MRPRLVPAASTGGRRPDLGNRYFRSAWEANYARYLSFVGEEWEYEARTFEFPVRRGNRFYTSDFYLPRRGEYHEVKGWADRDWEVKLSRMRRYYPDVKIVVIDEQWFREIYRAGWHKLIPNWEKVW
jgi:hypothetical protein